MIVEANTASNRELQTEHTDSPPDLKSRTADALRREIGFIPNPIFREMDANPGQRRRAICGPVGDEERGRQTESRHPLPAHLDQLCAAPLLSPEEERELFCRMNYLKYRANALRATLSETRPSARKLSELELLLQRATHVRNHILRANTRLVISIVKKFAEDANSFDELFSEGIACLMNAAEKFDFGRGFRFSTYATMAIRREIFRVMKRGRRQQARFNTGTSDVLDQKLAESESVHLQESYLQSVDRRLAELLERLDAREQFIVRARYGFIDLGRKPTFARLGEELGISKERVRQLEMRAMSKLRNMVDHLRDIDLSHLLGIQED